MSRAGWTHEQLIELPANRPLPIYSSKLYSLTKACDKHTSFMHLQKPKQAICEQRWDLGGNPACFGFCKERTRMFYCNNTETALPMHQKSLLQVVE